MVIGIEKSRFEREIPGVGRGAEFGERVGVGPLELLKMAHISSNLLLASISHCSLGYDIKTCWPLSDIFKNIK